MMPGSSIISGRGEAGGGGGGEEGRVGWCGLLFKPLPVTSLGAAMATNLTTPLDRALITLSAVSTSTPISDSSLIERSWSPTLKKMFSKVRLLYSFT